MRAVKAATKMTVFSMLSSISLEVNKHCLKVILPTISINLAICLQAIYIAGSYKNISYICSANSYSASSAIIEYMPGSAPY